MTRGGEEIWSEILSGALARLPRMQFDTWVATLRLGSFEAEKLTLEAPNAVYREWVCQRYLALIEELASAAAGRPVSVAVVLAKAQPPPEQAGPRSSAPALPPSSRLNPNYTFDNFVVGPSNRLSHAAALAVSESPGRAYNPLFLYGASGLGKTHLLHAICHRIAATKPGVQVHVLSCEEFINAFIHALEAGQVTSFRQRCRNVSVLLVDDIQFLGGSETTQEEIFHTFNTLFNAQRQIVLASDRSPNEIPKVEERLTSRFKWGLVARIDPPTFETRVAIVQKKAALQNVPLNDRVAQFIASRAQFNVREIEGALTHVATQSREAPVDEILNGLSTLFGTSAASTPSVTIQDIQLAVTRRFNVRLADLQSKKRLKSISRPRQICIYLARLLTQHSLEEIGGFFGGRDHSTIIYSEEHIRKLMEADTGVRTVVETLAAELQAQK